MTQSTTKDAILQNAERLLSDARLLFDNVRFPTSAALAVLSIEEFGKAISGMSDKHKSKQTSAAVHGWTKDLMDHLHKRGFKIRRIDDMSEHERNAVKGEKHMSSVTQGIIDGLSASEWHTIINEILQNKLSATKNSGFYVDIDFDDVILSQPSCVDSAAASRLIDMAATLLHDYNANKDNQI